MGPKITYTGHLKHVHQWWSLKVCPPRPRPQPLDPNPRIISPSNVHPTQQKHSLLLYKLIKSSQLLATTNPRMLCQCLGASKPAGIPTSVFIHSQLHAASHHGQMSNTLPKKLPNGKVKTGAFQTGGRQNICSPPPVCVMCSANVAVTSLFPYEKEHYYIQKEGKTCFFFQ